MRENKSYSANGSPLNWSGPDPTFYIVGEMPPSLLPLPGRGGGEIQQV